MARWNVYLDTNALISFFETDDSPIVFLFEQAAAGLVGLFTSELTLAEILVDPLRNHEDALADVYEEFLRTGDDDGFTVVPVSREILMVSARLRADWRGKIPDSIHVATALAFECGIVVSSDQRLRLPSGMTRIDVEKADDLDRWP